MSTPCEQKEAIASLVEWQRRQNGSLQRIEARVDRNADHMESLRNEIRRLLYAVIGAFGMLILNLAVLLFSQGS